MWKEMESYGKIHGHIYGHIWDIYGKYMGNAVEIWNLYDSDTLQESLALY